MSLNKFALIRYKTIDNCLQNRFRKWTIEELVEACSDALYEYEGITKGVSLRTVQLDIQNMRSEKLGYYAPIIVVDKKFYTYEDKNYSITNIPLTSQDLNTLDEVVGVLKQFKGFGYFKEVSEMITRLEDKIYKGKHKGKSYIEFEKNELLKGLQFIEPIHKAILSKNTLLMFYKSFKARTVSEIDFCGYLLKEYRNRWFVLGLNVKNNQILTLALDRIEKISVSDKDYKKAPFDVFSYYQDAIGVTKSINMLPEKIVLKIVKDHAPYILTKPIHKSQKIIEVNKEFTIISVDVVFNFELEREILGFGDYIEVVSPRSLRNRIKNRINSCYSIYNK